jgi:hypothetical protein
VSSWKVHEEQLVELTRKFEQLLYAKMPCTKPLNLCGWWLEIVDGGRRTGQIPHNRSVNCGLSSDQQNSVGPIGI